MLTQLTFNAPSIELKNLNNLWFQLSSSICNLKCKHCYLSCMPSTRPKGFLPLDKVKNTLEEARNLNVRDIYLHGGEPLLHPDLNTIIRQSLKVANVTILTNGLMINDKKARFLKQIEQNHDYEIIFRISLDHYTEEKNDEIRGRGVYKRVLSAIGSLIQHGFNPIVSAVNIWEEDTEELKHGYFRLLKKFEIEPEDINLKIIPPIKLGEYAKNYQSYQESELVTIKGLHSNQYQGFDCANSRVVTEKGIYACPILVNDPRGRVGNTLSDSSKKVFLEPNACYTCHQHNIGILNNSWSD